MDADVTILMRHAAKAAAVMGPGLCLVAARVEKLPLASAVPIAVLLAALPATGFAFDAMVWPLINVLVGAFCGAGVIHRALAARNPDALRIDTSLLFLPIAIFWFGSQLLFVVFAH